jgi:hypothetical protein
MVHCAGSGKNPMPAHLLPDHPHPLCWIEFAGTATTVSWPDVGVFEPIIADAERELRWVQCVRGEGVTLHTRVSATPGLTSAFFLTP